MSLKRTRILGIDLGGRRLGIALSDERHLIASPLCILEAKKSDKETVNALLAFIEQIEISRDCTISRIVVGLPLLMSGKWGTQAEWVDRFVALLSDHTSIPVQLWDERLTTVQADRLLREGQMNRKARAAVVDPVSAAIILQTFLDSSPVSSLGSSIQ